MCSFEHNFPLVHPMWRVSTKLYQLRDVTTCKFSLKDASLHQFDFRGHLNEQLLTYVDMSERKVSIVLPTAAMRCVHCNTTCVYITFRLTKTCICVTINITLCFPPTFPSIYLNSHTNTWLLLTNPFQYPTINIRNYVWVHWFDWYAGLLDLLNVKRRPSKQNVWLTRSCPCANFHIGGRVCM